MVEVMAAVEARAGHVRLGEEGGGPDEGVSRVCFGYERGVER